MKFTNQGPIKSAFLIIILMSLVINMNIGLAAEPQTLPKQSGAILSASDWQLDSTWTLENDELVSNGFGQAVQAMSCEEGLAALRFSIKSMNGEMYAILSTNGKDRYSINFSGNESRLFSVGLIQMTGADTEDRLLKARSIDYDMSQDIAVEIGFEEGGIMVYVNQGQDKSTEELLIDSADLASGLSYFVPDGLAFETTNNTHVRMGDVEIVCAPVFQEQAPPDLGDIEYKRPA